MCFREMQKEEAVTLRREAIAMIHCIVRTYGGARAYLFKANDFADAVAQCRQLYPGAEVHSVCEAVSIERVIALIAPLLAT